MKNPISGFMVASLLAAACSQPEDVGAVRGAVGCPEVDGLLDCDERTEYGDVPGGKVIGVHQMQDSCYHVYFETTAGDWIPLVQQCNKGVVVLPGAADGIVCYAREAGDAFNLSCFRIGASGACEGCPGAGGGAAAAPGPAYLYSGRRLPTDGVEVTFAQLVNDVRHCYTRSSDADLVFSAPVETSCGTATGLEVTGVRVSSFGSRYLEITATPTSDVFALRVTPHIGGTASPDRYVGPPLLVGPEGQPVRISYLVDDISSAAHLSGEDWGTVYVTGYDVIPATVYDVFAEADDPSVPTIGGRATTGIFGDINANGVVNFTDIQVALNAFLGIGMPLTADLIGGGSYPGLCIPNAREMGGAVNFVDIQMVVNAFLGKYAGTLGNYNPACLP